MSPSLFRFVSFSYPGRISSLAFSYSSFSIARRRTLCRLGPKQFFFCYFIQLFREREESFYYLVARLQCLADNKPMKATFELEGPLKSPFSPTSHFFVSFTHSHFLSSSSSLVFSRIFPFPFSFPLSLTWYHPSSVSLRVMPAVKISRRFFASPICSTFLFLSLIPRRESSYTLQSILVQSIRVYLTFRKVKIPWKGEIKSRVFSQLKI